VTVHPNVELMRNVYDAFTKGDVETAASYWTPDCVHYYPGHSPLSGEHRGVESAIAFAGQMFEMTQGQIEMEVLDIGASDDHAFAVLNTKYNRPGKGPLEMRFVNVAAIRNGKIASFWTYPDDQYAIDEFWA
jgi:ketosteroid isomerase-like protein